MPETTVATRMYQEAAEAPSALRRARLRVREAAGAAADRLRRLDPPFVATCARGSSDHAATYAKYLIETRVRLPVLSQAPSIQSVYAATSPRFEGAAMIAISQSGRSPDLLRTAEGAKAAGATLVSLVNDETSPLAALADVLVPLSVGAETSVAATKSFIGALAALLSLAGEWAGAEDLRAQTERLPDVLERAWERDWSAAVAPLAKATNLFVLGRGLSFGIAQEAALKFKETCGLHAEPFSTAEVAHGPAALVGSGFPVLVFPPHDAAAAGLREQIAAFRDRGAFVMVAGEGWGGDIELPTDGALPTETAPIAAVQSFYRLVDAVARARGRDPDRPPNLRKVTCTR